MTNVKCFFPFLEMWYFPLGKFSMWTSSQCNGQDHFSSNKILAFPIRSVHIRLHNAHCHSGNSTVRMDHLQHSIDVQLTSLNNIFKFKAM
jgi:hypothetical protein